MENEIKNSKKVDECRKISVRTKILLILSIALFVFGLSAATISYKIYMDSSVEQHKRFAIGISNIVADTVDPNRVDEYLSKGIALQDYKETRQKLYRIKEISPDIEFVYVYKIMEDGCHVVFDIDSEDWIGDPAGNVQEFDESFAEYIPKLLKGEEIEPIISDDTYGWLLTVYTPVYD